MFALCSNPFAETGGAEDLHPTPSTQTLVS